VIGIVRDTIAPDLPVLVAAFIGNVARVAILSWILMPASTHRFDAWLRRGPVCAGARREA